MRDRCKAGWAIDANLQMNEVLRCIRQNYLCSVRQCDHMAGKLIVSYVLTSYLNLKSAPCCPCSWPQVLLRTFQEKHRTCEDIESHLFVWKG